MKNNIGVMQGRLLPKYQGRYQAHPVGNWQKEFEAAQQVGLDCIEFILDFNKAKDNPIMKKSGIEEIKACTEKTGVIVQTICADYFMEAPLHSKNKLVADQSQAIMVQLLSSANDLGLTDIVIPCVDKSSMNGKEAINRFVERMVPIVQIAEKFGINLALETDLAPQPFVDLLERFKSDNVTVNYDTGNSAALGHNPVQELNVYGDKITSIHIKDRALGGDSVILGEGVADFAVFFNKLKEFKYKGPFIMQAFRDEEGVKIFKKQLAWIAPFIELELN